MREYVLLYQVGIANVFRVPALDRDAIEQGPARVYQSDYRSAEVFCAGLIESGASVKVQHCDLAGDALLHVAKWADGCGELWRDQKCPPIMASGWSEVPF
jgi:hypothetical protein